MKVLDKILLTQDFSKSSNDVLDTAIDLAKVFKSKITPIHVLTEHIENDKVKQLLNETTVSKLKESTDKIKSAGIETGEPLLESGSAVDSIVRAAVRVNANLIVVGAGSIENLESKSFKLGTTTERIIQKSDKPVFVVKENTPLNVQHILCPVDFSAASKRALSNAIIMGRKFRAELTILSVCELQDASWFSSEQAKEEESNSRYLNHKKQFDTFLEGFSLTGLNWVKECPKGKPAEEILSAISGKMIDLLVIGTNGRTGLNRLIMGSVTEKVIREVPCSFLTLKSEDAFSLHLETNINDLEQRYDTGIKLMNDGFYEEAIGQFKACLNINNMHIPAYLGIAKVYEKLNNPEKAKMYRDKGLRIKEKIWYGKIEDEVRKLRGSS
jgi:nucleotide-binding universal stress UspA family protein